MENHLLMENQKRKEKRHALIGKELNKLYYDVASPSAYTSKVNVFRAAKQIFPRLKRHEIDDWFGKQLTSTLHKPIRHNFPRNKIIVFHIDEIWQMDLVDMSDKAHDNDGYTFILSCIDCFSKFAWAIPIKNKTGNSIVCAIQKILKSGRKCKRIHTDKGTEFLNTKVQQLLKKNKIKFYTTQSEKKAPIVERFNRTMESRMYKYFTAQNTYRYIDVLQKIIDGYNNTYHRSIKMKPANMKKHHQIQIRQHLYGVKEKDKKNTKSKNYKYMIGDNVRIIKTRLTFHRGYHQNWSNEIFIIYDRKHFRETIYYLQDYNGEKIQGGFYEKELQRVLPPDEYKIDKILKTKTIGGKQLLLVSWLGWPSSFDSYIEAESIQKS